MKYFSFLLSMLVVTAAIGQKPLDRGIHKRTTGGVSFLFGEKKANKAEKADVIAFDDVVALETLSPTELPVEVEPAGLLQSDAVFAVAVAEPMEVETFTLSNRAIRKLNRRALSLVAGPASEKKLFRRANPLMAASEDGEGGLDWASVVALVTGILGFVVPGSWLLAIIFGAIGMKRTKDGSLRGRGMAVAGFVLGLVVPLVVLLLIGLIFAAATV